MTDEEIWELKALHDLLKKAFSLKHITPETAAELLEIAYQVNLIDDK